MAATASPAPTIVTPSPMSARPEQSTNSAPKSAEKLPLPNPMKRRLLFALEAECRNIDDLLQRKRQLIARKAFERAREVASRNGS